MAQLYESHSDSLAAFNEVSQRIYLDVRPLSARNYLILSHIYKAFIILSFSFLSLS
jgi:hypothetical protein